MSNPIPPQGTDKVETGLLLVQLGTPDAPTPSAVRRYLGEFLWDPRVVDLPRPLWWLILHGLILRTRPRRSAALYEQIWLDEGSPLLVATRRQAAALSAELHRRMPGQALAVAAAMRYGNPSVPATLEALRAAGCRRLLVLPLYPQYCGATTGSAFDAVTGVFRHWRGFPELRFINQYHTEPGYVDALVASVREIWEDRGQPDRLLISFHGQPWRHAREGDPYQEQCRETAASLAEALALPLDRWTLSFQSRFGREPWLEPCTSDVLAQWGGAGVKKIDVICPGFASDCLETLEEINIAGRNTFMRAGGEQFRYIHALNDRPEHIAALAGLVQRHLMGWEKEGV